MTTFNTNTGARVPESPIVQKAESFTRPSNTTAYTAGDSVAPVTVAITAASNATPIVVTAASHGLATGDRVTIASVGGNTNANGLHKVVVLTSSTFALYNEATGAAIAGNSAYTSGGTLQRIPRLTDVVPAPGGSGAIVAVQLQVRNATVTNGTFRVRFFQKPFAAIADNAAFTLLDAQKAFDLGYVDLTILTTDGSGSDMSEVVALLAQPLPFVCASDRVDIYPIVTALGAFTPASADTFRLNISVRRDQVGALARMSPTV